MSGAIGPVGAQINPEDADNAQDVEHNWGFKAVQHMLTYWKILESMRGSQLKLTKIDDEIHEHFQKEFPDFDLSATIDEDAMKSAEGKERWRNFINSYQDKIDDYNFGSMLRASPKAEYEEKDTIFAVRMQFYAIEIARNRAGLNDWIYEKEQQ